MSAVVGAEQGCPSADPGRVLDRLTRAVSVVSVRTDATVHAVTVDSLTCVSTDPSMVLVSLRAGSRMLDLVRRSGLFGVSLLASDQAEVARWFASRRRGTGAGQFASVPCWDGTCSGAPLLTGALAWLECRVDRDVPAGDHLLVIGTVLEVIDGGWGRRPLLRHDRTYRGLSVHPLPRPDGETETPASSAVSARGRGPLWR